MIRSLIRRLHTNFILDYKLLSCSYLSNTERLGLLLRKYLAIALNRQSIFFLSRTFYYDNRLAPGMLQAYPDEIQSLGKVIKLSEISSLLDVGANIGQFAVTMNHFYPSMEIYSFEPNKAIYPILEKNVNGIKNIKAFNYGLGSKSGTHKFFFSPSASQEGSFFRENMHQNFTRPDVKMTSVDIICLDKKQISSLNLPRHFDLVKIDVEGAELEVLKSLAGISFDYLYIELSQNRKGGGNLEAVGKVLKSNLKVNPTLLYIQDPVKEVPCINAIFSIKKGN